jgi:hypothetical protein
MIGVDRVRPAVVTHRRRSIIVHDGVLPAMRAIDERIHDERGF